MAQVGDDDDVGNGGREDLATRVLEDYHPARVFTLVYQPFALGTMAILTYNEARINTRKRNIVGYLLASASTLMLLLLDLATSGKGGIGPFVGICAVVGIFGVADVQVNGGMVGDLSLMCPEFIQVLKTLLSPNTLHLQNSFSSALTSEMCTVLLRWHGCMWRHDRRLKVDHESSFRKCSLWPSQRSSYVESLTAQRIIIESKLLSLILISHIYIADLPFVAVLFMAVSTSMEFLCFLLYAFYLPKIPIVNYYRNKASMEGSKTVSADLKAAGIHTPTTDQGERGFKPHVRLSSKELLIQNMDYATVLFLVYMLTLYMLVLIATFNSGDLLGRYVILVERIKLKSRRGLMTAALARFLLVPAFYFTAKYGDKGWMIALTLVLGLTNGYLTVCVMTSAPQGYKGPEQNALGNLLVFFLLVGICVGVVLDWMWLIGNKNAF
ncbi:unnamed protein product [Linum tenue]|uniref:Uncharacterized protein n=1 Tax=Linum tenue TaxID=586396 RepID=A0AAV0GSI8_9ROSI|nr:unnamed protein product [Linum tenue]